MRLVSVSVDAHLLYENHNGVYVWRKRGQLLVSNDRLVFCLVQRHGSQLIRSTEQLGREINRPADTYCSSQWDWVWQNVKRPAIWITDITHYLRAEWIGATWYEVAFWGYYLKTELAGESSWQWERLWAPGKTGVDYSLSIIASVAYCNVCNRERHLQDCPRGEAVVYPSNSGRNANSIGCKLCCSIFATG